MLKNAIPDTEYCPSMGVFIVLLASTAAHLRDDARMKHRQERWRDRNLEYMYIRLLSIIYPEHLGLRRYDTSMFPLSKRASHTSYEQK